MLPRSPIGRHASLALRMLVAATSAESSTEVSRLQLKRDASLRLQKGGRSTQKDRKGHWTLGCEPGSCRVAVGPLMTALHLARSSAPSCCLSLSPHRYCLENPTCSRTLTGEPQSTEKEKGGDCIQLCSPQPCGGVQAEEGKLHHTLKWKAFKAGHPFQQGLFQTGSIFPGPYGLVMSIISHFQSLFYPPPSPLCYLNLASLGERLSSLQRNSSLRRKLNPRAERVRENDLPEIGTQEPGPWPHRWPPGARQCQRLDSARLSC